MASVWSCGDRARARRTVFCLGDSVIDFANLVTNYFRDSLVVCPVIQCCTIKTEKSSEANKHEADDDHDPAIHGIDVRGMATATVKSVRFIAKRAGVPA